MRRRVKKECIDTIIGKSYVGDWFLFYLLGQNIDSVIFKVRLSPPTFRLVPSRVRICKLLRSPGICSLEKSRNRFLGIDFCAGIFEQSMGQELSRNRVLEPEPVFLNVYGAQESIPRNEFRQPM